MHSSSIYTVFLFLKTISLPKHTHTVCIYLRIRWFWYRYILKSLKEVKNTSLAELSIIQWNSMRLLSKDKRTLKQEQETKNFTEACPTVGMHLLAIPKLNLISRNTWEQHVTLVFNKGHSSWAIFLICKPAEPSSSGFDLYMLWWYLSDYWHIAFTWTWVPEEWPWSDLQ